MTALNDSFREILAGRRYAILATHNEDGSIHTTPVWYLFENERLYIGSASSSRKAKNAAARPQATLIVDSRSPGREIWVYASGHVIILSGDESREINSKIFARYLTEEALKNPQIGPAFAMADDITICLVPEVWRFARSKDVDEQFFGGLLGRTPEKWFRPLDD